MKSAKEAGSALPKIAVAAAVGLGASLIANVLLARRAERQNPPAGSFVDVDGVRLHYIDRGKGDAIVLLHGNGSMVEDFISSGLVEALAPNHRVIAFDRPGFGHSERSRFRIWTDVAQAKLIHDALRTIGVRTATIVGHSWGCSVALAMGLDHPSSVSKLVLASGYFYPSIRADAVGMSLTAFPIVGDLIRYAVSPMFGRLMWPVFMKKMFGPLKPPTKFASFPKEMTFRPSQIRAASQDSLLMVPDAFARSFRYNELKMPIVIIAGTGDRIVDIEEQSARLHGELPHSVLHRIHGAGHMVHQSATERMLIAIEDPTSFTTSVDEAD